MISNYVKKWQRSATNHNFGLETLIKAGQQNCVHTVILGSHSFTPRPIY